MKKFGFVFVFMLGFFAQSAMADLMGLANGRSANLDNMADMSVEGGANIFSNGNLLGARANFKASPDIMVFGDVGLLSIENFNVDSDGLVYGFGAFYQLRNVTLLENTDFAVKGAYHLGTLEFDSSGTDIDYSEISIDALISGDQLAETGFGWYGNIGYHIVDTDLGNSTLFAGTTNNDILIGGGVTKALAFGEFFLGLDFIDAATFVGGIRYNL